jgi:hypothetical protein
MAGAWLLGFVENRLCWREVAIPARRARIPKQNGFGQGSRSTLV